MTQHPRHTAPLIFLIAITCIGAGIALSAREPSLRPAHPDGEEVQSFQPYTNTSEPGAKKSSTNPLATPPSQKTPPITDAVARPAGAPRARPSLFAGTSTSPAQLAELIQVDSAPERAHATAHAAGSPDLAEPAQTDQALLGPGRWMAKPDELERLKRDVEIERKQTLTRQALALQAHQHDTRAMASQLVQARARACFKALRSHEPAASGHLVVACSLRAHRGQGTITQARITSAHYLRQPDFQLCITRGLEGMRFRTESLETLSLETDFPVKLP